MGVAGRSISSSRLAPTISGSVGASREAMTRRHTRTTLTRRNWAQSGWQGATVCPVRIPSASIVPATDAVLGLGALSLGAAPASATSASSQVDDTCIG